MFSRNFLSSLCALLCLCFASADERPYVPDVKGSYRAIGDIVMFDAKENSIVQFAFEENFDQTNHVSSFWSSVSGTNSTILEQLQLKQTFQFSQKENDDTPVKVCEPMTSTAWEASGMDLGITHNLTGGQIIFSLRQWLSLDETNLAPNGWRTNVVYRGQQASKFAFTKIPAKEPMRVDAYWSDEAGGTSMSVHKVVPLSFVAYSTGQKEEKVLQRMNIFLFTHNEVNSKLLQPPRGVFCPGRVSPAPFRGSITKWTTLAFSTEFTWPDKTLITSVKTWMDTESGLARADFEPLNTLSGATTNVDSPAQIMIVVKVQEAVFHISNDGTRECKVTSLKDELYYPELIFNSQGDWSPDSFFGLDKNEYVHVSKVVERGVPCEVFQAQRTDWPPGVQNVTTVWEWCVANSIIDEVVLPENGVGLVSLNIYVTDSIHKRKENLPTTGQRYTYHFHDARTMSRPHMDILAFDISPCFVQERKESASFLVEMSNEDQAQVLKLSSNVQFDAEWREVLFKNSGLKNDSLRISNIRTSFQNFIGPLIVEFTILDHHPDLSETVRLSSVNMATAIDNLKKAIENKKLTMTWKIENSVLTLTAKPGSYLKKSTSTPSPNTNTPAFYKALSAIAEHKNANEDSQGYSNFTFGIVGVVSMQIGVAIGVAFVAYRKHKRVQEQLLPAQ